MFIDNEVTRFQNGVTNRPVGNILNSLKTMDPTRYHTFFEDFDYYTAADWTVTEDGAATQALADGDGGLLLITNAAADDNHSFSQKVGESFLFQVGRKLFFKARLQVNDATESDLVFGLQITDATPLAVTDGVYFQKDDGDAELDIHSAKNSVLVSEEAIALLEDDTFVELAFFWDGESRIYYGVDDTVMGYITPGDGLPDDEVLTVSFGIQNGEAVAKTMTVDYIFAAVER